MDSRAIAVESDMRWPPSRLGRLVNASVYRELHLGKRFRDGPARLSISHAPAQGLPLLPRHKPGHGLLAPIALHHTLAAGQHLQRREQRPQLARSQEELVLLRPPVEPPR